MGRGRPNLVAMRLRRFALPLAAVAFALAIPGTAAAAGDATGWSLLADADASSIDEHIAAGYRLIEIDSLSTSPDRFAATFAPDSQTGPDWWWYHDLQFDEIEAKLAEHGARLTRLEGYGSDRGVRYAALMVDNTGPAAKAWWWWIGAPDQLDARVAELGARIIDLERHPDGLVSAVMVARDRVASWSYLGRSQDEIQSLLVANQASPIDIEPAADGLFDVVMAKSSRRSWWYVGKSSEELIDIAGQNGARLVDVDEYKSDAGTVYAGIMVTNVSRATTRVNELLRSAVKNEGRWGLYLKEVNGAELSAINERRHFEPASMIKVLYHLKAVYSHQADLSYLDDTEMTWYAGLSGSCPTGTAPTSNAMSDVLRQMMQYSDNRAAQAILNEFGGFSGMNEFAAQLGAADTAVNHDIGCAEGAVSSPNQLTLYDAGLLYERASNRSLLTPAASEKFKRLMTTAVLNRVASIVRGRRAGGGLEGVRGLAPRMKLSIARREKFLSKVRMAWKGGSYTLCTPSCRYDWTLGGWTSIPLKTRSGRIVRRAYVFGMFTEGATTEVGASRAWDRGPEVLRPILHRALLSWKRARR
jgi:beta-lactamase family protein/polyglycine hydrolase-like protein